MATDFFEQMQAMKDRGEVDEGQVCRINNGRPACMPPGNRTMQPFNPGVKRSDLLKIDVCAAHLVDRPVDRTFVCTTPVPSREKWCAIDPLFER